MGAREIRRPADEGSGGLRTIGKRLAENPVAALLAAVAAGLLAGLVLRLFRSTSREE